MSGESRARERPGASAGPLLGREADLAQLGKRLGRGNPVLVLGEAGIGKTALLREAARRSGRSTYEGGALATLSYLPYLPIARALGREPEGRDHAAVANEVAQCVDGGLLILDDLHWADADTVALLPLLAGRIALAAAVCRGDPHARAALAAADACGFVVQEAAGLDARASAELLHRLRPGLGNEEAARIVRHARGNPLLLEELIVGDDASPTLAASLRSRFGRASAAGREALARLALLGRPAEHALLGEGVSELVEAGLALAEGETVAIRHALLGEVALASVPAAALATTHATLASLLESPGEAARHHLAAGELDAAYSKALAAVETARWPGERAHHLAVAAQAAPPTGRLPLCLRAADALNEAGEFQAAEQLLEGTTSDDARLQAEIHLHRARARFGLGDGDGLERELDAGLALVSGSGLPVEARLALERVEIPNWSWDPARTMALAGEAHELARRAGVEEARAEMLLGNAHYLALSLRDAEDHVRRAVALASATGEADVELGATALLAAVLELANRTTEAAALVASAQRRARELGVRRWEHWLRSGELHLEYNRGGASESLAASLQQLLAEPGLGYVGEQVRVELGLLLADLGREEEARDLLALELDAPFNRAYAAYVQAELAWLNGELAAAVEHAERTMTLAKGPLAGFAALTRGWALAELGHPPGSTSGLGDTERLPAMDLTLSGVRALVEEGGADEASRLLTSAAGIWLDGFRREGVRCLWGAGEAARRAGAAARARELLLSAEWEAARAIPALVPRIRRSLRLAGVRAVARRGAAGHGLSAREQEVLILVGHGLTSAEIAGRLGLSRSTVESHVRSAMRKLGARTRAQAAAVAARE